MKLFATVRNRPLAVKNKDIDRFLMEMLLLHCHPDLIDRQMH